MAPEATLLTKIISDGVETGSMEMDHRGYIKFIPNDDELKAIETYLAEELARTLSDYESLFQEAVNNVNCYRHAKITLETGKAILPAPIARIPADHIIASSFTTVMNARPIFSFDPYFSGKFPVAVPAPEGFPMIPAGTPMSVSRSSEEIAKNLERGFEFKLRERLDFETKLQKAIRGAVIGCPFWWKVCADPKSRDLMGPKVDGAFIDLSQKYSFRQKGEIVQLYLVPFFNLIKPVDVAEDELDEGPWVAERTPCDPADVIRGFYSKDFFLLVDKKDADTVASQVSDIHNPFQQAIAAMIQQKVSQKPRQQCPKFLVWFYRDALFKDPETGEKTIKRLNLIGDYHLGAKRLLNCYLNPNEHQSRPYVFCDQMEEGDSTVKILRWHQDVATHLMQAQIKNAFIANNINYTYNPDSDAEDWFKKHPTIEAGEVIGAGKKGEDWDTFTAGTAHESLLMTWQAVVAEAKVASKVSGPQAGENIPGRTPASTMSQVLQQGAQEGILFLRRLSRGLSKVIRLYLETARQFQPLGETIPIFDPVQKQIIEIPFRFPVGEMLDNFRIALTASDQALQRERDSERIVMWKTVLMQDAEFVAKISAALVDQKTTPALMALFEKALLRNEKLISKIIQLSDTDEDDFDLSAEIDALVKEQNAARMQMQAMMEAQNGNPAAAGQGAVPGPAGQPNGGGPVGAAPQPNVPPPSVQASAGGVQGAQQIQ